MFYDVIPHQTMSELCLYMDLTYHVLKGSAKVCLLCDGLYAMHKGLPVMDKGPMTSCHLIPMWHEWNANANDIMMTWFALDANLLMSCMACVMCACVHGACALSRTNMSK